MELDTKPADAAPANSTKSRAIRCVFAVFTLVLAVLILILAIPDTQPPRFTWLTPQQVQPGPIEKLRDRFMRWTSPLWRGYWSRQPLVFVSSTLLNVPTTSASQFELGAPIATNNHGAMVWMLSAAEHTTLREKLKTMPKEMILGSPRVQTAAGTRAGVSMLNGQAGLTMNLMAKASRASWMLTMGATLTESAQPATSNLMALQTNFAVTCRAMIPNAGALVMRSANSIVPTGTNHWLITSPVTVDARGKPVKL